MLAKTIIILIIPALTTEGVLLVKFIKNIIDIIKIIWLTLFLLSFFVIKFTIKIMYEKCAPEIASK